MMSVSGGDPYWGEQPGLLNPNPEWTTCTMEKVKGGLKRVKLLPREDEDPGQEEKEGLNHGTPVEVVQESGGGCPPCGPRVSPLSRGPTQAPPTKRRKLKAERSTENVTTATSQPTAMPAALATHKLHVVQGTEPGAACRADGKEAKVRAEVLDVDDVVESLEEETRNEPDHSTAGGDVATAETDPEPTAIPTAVLATPPLLAIQGAGPDTAAVTAEGDGEVDAVTVNDPDENVKFAATDIRLRRSNPKDVLKLPQPPRGLSGRPLREKAQEEKGVAEAA